MIVSRFGGCHLRRSASNYDSKTLDIVVSVHVGGPRRHHFELVFFLLLVVILGQPQPEDSFVFVSSLSIMPTTTKSKRNVRRRQSNLFQKNVFGASSSNSSNSNNASNDDFDTATTSKSTKNSIHQCMKQFRSPLFGGGDVNMDGRVNRIEYLSILNTVAHDYLDDNDCPQNSTKNNASNNNVMLRITNAVNQLFANYNSTACLCTNYDDYDNNNDTNVSASYYGSSSITVGNDTSSTSFCCTGTPYVIPYQQYRNTDYVWNICSTIIDTVSQHCIASTILSRNTTTTSNNNDTISSSMEINPTPPNDNSNGVIVSKNSTQYNSSSTALTDEKTSNPNERLVTTCLLYFFVLVLILSLIGLYVNTTKRPLRNTKTGNDDTNNNNNTCNHNSNTIMDNHLSHATVAVENLSSLSDIDDDDNDSVATSSSEMIRNLQSISSSKSCIVSDHDSSNNNKYTHSISKDIIISEKNSCDSNDFRKHRKTRDMEDNISDTDSSSSLSESSSPSNGDQRPRRNDGMVEIFTESWNRCRNNDDNDNLLKEAWNEFEQQCSSQPDDDENITITVSKFDEIITATPITVCTRRRGDNQLLVLAPNGSAPMCTTPPGCQHNHSIATSIDVSLLYMPKDLMIPIRKHDATKLFYEEVYYPCDDEIYEALSASQIVI